jgi:hypothetical protein
VPREDKIITTVTLATTSFFRLMLRYCHSSGVYRERAVALDSSILHIYLVRADRCRALLHKGCARSASSGVFREDALSATRNAQRYNKEPIPYMSVFERHVQIYIRMLGTWFKIRSVKGLHPQLPV